MDCSESGTVRARRYLLHGERYNRGVRRLALLLALCVPVTVFAQPLVITAPAAPGGGWDQTARAMQHVLGVVESGLNTQVDNVPGAAGTIGLARFIQSERGNPAALLVTGLVMVSGTIINASPVSLAETTPIARLTGEYEVIVVPASSPLRSLGDLVTAFRTDPGAVSWGGGSAGGTDDLLIRLLAEQAGVQPSRVNYIAFSGGGAALAAVLGGQLTAAVSGYAEFAGQIEAGQLRVLAVSSPERVPSIDAPTIRESSLPLDLANWRAVVAPPGLSEREQSRLVDQLTRMHDSAEWRAVLAQNGWDDLFLTGPAFKQFLLSEQARIDAVLRRLSAPSTQAASSAAVLTPSPVTLPYATAALFLIALALTLWRHRPAQSLTDRAAIGHAIAALVLLPLLFDALGFVVASTVTFGLVTMALRSPPRRLSIVDLIVGAAFAALLFIVFTRGLGVALPSGSIF